MTETKRMRITYVECKQPETKRMRIIRHPAAQTLSNDPVFVKGDRVSYSTIGAKHPQTGTVIGHNYNGWVRVQPDNKRAFPFNCPSPRLLTKIEVAS